MIKKCKQSVNNLHIANLRFTFKFDDRSGAESGGLKLRKLKFPDKNNKLSKKGCS